MQMCHFWVSKRVRGIPWNPPQPASSSETVHIFLVNHGFCPYDFEMNCKVKTNITSLIDRGQFLAYIFDKETRIHRQTYFGADLCKTIRTVNTDQCVQGPRNYHNRNWDRPCPLKTVLIGGGGDPTTLLSKPCLSPRPPSER